MSNLVEAMLGMMDGGMNDAIFFQPKKGNGEPNPLRATVIIRRIRILTGEFSWAVHSLQPGQSAYGFGVISGSGMYGSIDEVTRFTEKWYDRGSTDYEWVGMDYCDADFPLNLIL